MKQYTRKELADLILQSISPRRDALSQMYAQSRSTIGHFWIDDLLPEDIARHIHQVFPKASEMVLKKSIREDKYIAAQMDRYHPILEEVIYAFQDERVVGLIGEICQIPDIFPDENLYAGGLSAMGNRQFLNPHLDNSHDRNRNRWRVLNILYYVTPEWKEEYGGNLELWPAGLKGDPLTIHSKFNRLALMATHNDSLHSVSPVVYDGFRCCVSNYYFSDKPLSDSDTFHVTKFRGRPNQKLTDAVLRIDAWLRMGLRKIFKKGVRENPHVYKRDEGPDKP